MEAPSQFSQYPWITLPAGRDFTPQLPPVGVVDGDLLGLADAGADADRLGETDGDGEAVRDGDGELVGLPPVQAPRSFHSDGVAAGFQPAPT
ncbi:hypothetical protein GCM10018962_20730 [Dactylosporangium matsuzakiense]|uniref:Uncharacterized protein n=1 Tax=Dactylosporangium matsuzakiense TaxID=53360 RepID=A0A9W6NMZ5_9ACTN|nr:hypothetical protein GCM10017581_051600 [Dactylosporangium matsuzakiense]